MSLIEKAVQRLEELRRAGVTVGGDDDNVERSAEPVTPAGNAAEPEAKPVSEARSVPDVVSAETIAETSASQPDSAAPEVQEPHHPATTPSIVSVVSQQAKGRETSKYLDIDTARLTEIGLVTPDAPRSRVADEFRVIKRPLLSNAQGKGAAPVRNGNLIMVTSSLPGEGKSFTSINLAMSMAMELDSTVLLVDADVARPSMLRIMGLPPAKGLMDVLSGDRLDLSEVLIRTNIGKLTLLPAGTSHPRATEMLASEAMGRLLDEIATRYPDRIVIFDSPPLLVTTEARTLATNMGQIVMVIEAEKTTHGTAKQALTTIESCPVVMLMLNKGARGGGEGYYGYYGYGGYGGYGSYGSYGYGSN